MEIEIILKIELKDKVGYKADSFWSLTEKTYAKIHDISEKDRLINNLLKSLNGDGNQREWNGYKIGYDLVLEKDEENPYKIKTANTGPWIYKIQLKDGTYSLIDISRKAKLEEINRRIKERI